MKEDAGEILMAVREPQREIRLQTTHQRKADAPSRDCGESQISRGKWEEKLTRSKPGVGGIRKQKLERTALLRHRSRVQQAWGGRS